jgi:hypothetical protein
MKNMILSMVMLLAMNAGTMYPATNAVQLSNTNADYLGSFYNQDDASAQRAKNIQPPNPVWTVIKVILYVGVFGVAAYFIVKFVLSKGAVPATEDANIVEVIMTKPAGMGSYLQIVKVGPTYYLLSLSGDGLRYIDKITDKETLDFIDLNKDKIKPKETKFFDFLTYLPLNRKPDRMDFLKNQKDKLKKL